MGREVLPTLGKELPGFGDPGGDAAHGADEGDSGDDGDDRRRASVQRFAGRVYAGAAYLTLTDWQQLMSSRGWDSRWQTLDRRLVQSRGDRRLTLVAGVPVVNQNGHYRALPAAVHVTSPAAGKDSVFIPVAVLKRAFDWSVRVIPPPAEQGGGGPAGGETVRVEITPSPETEWPAPTAPPRGRQAIVDALAFLQHPIAGAEAGFRDSHLPGAARAYRNGTHEGFDWYGYAVGVEVTRETGVRAMADGTVIRAGHDWTTPSAALRAEWLAAAKNADHTPAWILDKLRGRQVWVSHRDGVMIRYAHLSGIPSGVRVGATVDAGAVVGYVGNSGTSQEVAGTDRGLHLHSDIFVYGENVWLDFEPQPLREMINEILARSS